MIHLKRNEATNRLMAINKDRLLNIRAMMFDLDGTLIDSIPTYFQLMETILEVVGLPPAPKSLVAEIHLRHDV